MSSPIDFGYLANPKLGTFEQLRTDAQRRLAECSAEIGTAEPTHLTDEDVHFEFPMAELPLVAAIHAADWIRRKLIENADDVSTRRHRAVENENFPDLERQVWLLHHYLGVSFETITTLLSPKTMAQINRANREAERELNKVCASQLSGSDSSPINRNMAAAIQSQLNDFYQDAWRADYGPPNRHMIRLVRRNIRRIIDPNGTLKGIDLLDFYLEFGRQESERRMSCLKPVKRGGSIQASQTIQDFAAQTEHTLNRLKPLTTTATVDQTLNDHQIQAQPHRSEAIMYSLRYLAWLEKHEIAELYQISPDEADKLIGLAKEKFL